LRLRDGPAISCGRSPAGTSERSRAPRVSTLLPTEMRQLKRLEDENSRLKKIVVDLTLDREMLQDVIRRKI
jgi:hypothetical protein